MRTLNFIIPEEYNDSRLIDFLRGYAEFSAALVTSLRCREEAVRLNGKHHRMIDKVFTGDSLEIHIPENTQSPLLWDEPIEIIFEDDDILVVNKPSGISTHPTYNHPNGTLCNAVANYLQKTKNEPSAGRAIGRLDKVTSGVVIFAKNSFAASFLNGKLQKVYNALVWGQPEETGTVDIGIYRPDPHKTERAVSESGDRAITHWKTIQKLQDMSLLEIRTETGRTHQIRVHLSHVGYPLVGDDMYGGATTESIKRAALHCLKITITHPVTREELTFSAPLPDDIKKEIDLQKEIGNTY